MKLFFLLFSEKSAWTPVNGTSVLPLGHHRKRLLWPTIHRPLQCSPLARSNKTSQETGQKYEKPVISCCVKPPTMEPKSL